MYVKIWTGCVFQARIKNLHNDNIFIRLIRSTDINKKEENMNSYQDYIRNFCIIAHIDHGKSTLADRIIENTGLVAHRDMKEQYLDNMDIERERGITIKLQTTRLMYKAKDGHEYIFNLIDTPGHVDFTYEVSRSLAACEGAVLIVDATQGVEAQTLATVYLALGENLEIIPVLNQIDLGSARPDEVKEVGVYSPGPVPMKELTAGDVVYIVASIKQVADARVGDTVTLDNDPTEEAFPGYKKVQPMVYCGIYPAEGEKYESVKDALEKLQVNDAAFLFEPETSTALGFGFRCGFLGLLHMEIIVERLEREFDLGVITTSPSVIYKVVMNDGTIQMIQNPSNLPNLILISHIEEPIVKADIMIPKDYVGSIMELCQDRRGKLLHMEYITETRVQLHYEMPLNEVIYDFFDALKSKTRGYGSLDYEFIRYEKSNVVKMDLLLNKELVDAFSMIVHESKAYARGKFVCEKLKEIIPMHQFEVPIQASIGQKIIARETVRAFRKDVIAKCYGGDISRKKKLLEKQKEGKKRMRQFGSVEVPQEAFTAVLKYDDNK